jgi:hypothetical protein
MNKIVEVTVIEERDGVRYKTRLQGDAADEWAKYVNSALVLDHAHGGESPDVKWETINE